MAFFRILGRFFKGLWHGLDGLRKVLHLIVLLVLFGIFFAASRSSLPYLPGSAALVLAPEGRIVEQLSGDALDRALQEASGEGRPETRLQDLLDVIDEAAGDRRIKALVLDLSRLETAGLPVLQDIGQALGKFRESGKKVFVWGAYFDQRQYYLAAHADETYLDPFGAVIIEGYGYFRQYLKGTVDKLGVEVHVFKAGTYKSATETFSRTDMSAEDREEATVWVNQLWEGWKRGTAVARGLEPAVLQDYADKAAEGVAEAEGDLAQYALRRGLVDGLKTLEQFDARVIEEAGADDDGISYRSVDWRAYLTVLRSEEALHRAPLRNVGVVVAAGEILDGEQPPGTVGGDSLAALLRDARLDDSIYTVVLRVDSPGGSMLASEQISREISALRDAGKPVVVSMGTQATSGGYYFAAPADRILASAETITGSIGVFVMFPTFEQTLAKIGITSDGFGTTTLSGASRLDRPLNPELARVLQSSVDNSYRKFVSHVALSRQRPYEEIDGIAQGRVWSGADALKAGLIDGLGSLEDAIADAAALAGLEDDYGVQWVEPAYGWQQMLAMRLRVSAARIIAWSGLQVRSPMSSVMSMLPANLRNLIELGRAGKPIYWCACRVE